MNKVSNSIRYLKVQIIRIVEDEQPGWIEVSFKDANDSLITIFEKVPVLIDYYGDLSLLPRYKV